MEVKKLSIDYCPSWMEYAEGIGLETSPEAEIDAQRFYTFAKNKLKPRAVYTVSYITDRRKTGGETALTIDNRLFTGKTLHKLDKISRVFPYIATAGTGLLSPDISSFHNNELITKWAGVLQYMALIKMREVLTDHLKKEFQTGNLNSINPGSGNAENWPVAQNVQVFGLMNRGEDSGVKLKPDGLMTPPYSISGFLFESEHFYVNCLYCSRENCPGRKAPGIEEIGNS